MISEKRERDFNEIATIKTLKKKAAKMYQKEKGERSAKSRERAGEEGARGKGLMLFEAADRLHSVLLFVCLFVLLIYRPFLQSHSVSEPIIISSREYASPDPPPCHCTPTTQLA